MGKGSVEALNEVEQIRAQLQDDIAALEERVPAAARWTKRALGIAVGGGIGMKIVRRLVRRWARKKARAQGLEPAHADGQLSTKVAWAAAGAGLGAAAVALGTRPTQQLPTR